MKNYLLKPIDCIFPFIQLIRANKRLLLKDKTISKAIASKTNIDEQMDYMKGYKNLTLEDIKGFYGKTIEVKKSLEEKLKVSLFSVTVGIIILTFMVNFLYQDRFFEMNGAIKTFAFLAASLSIIYMIFAAFCAIKTISDIAKVHQLFPKDLVNVSNKKEEEKELLAIYAERNSITNIIRQNYMNTSYRCIIILLCLSAILFFTLGINSFRVNSKKRIAAIESKLNGLNNSVAMLKEDISIFETHMLDEKVVTKKSIQEIQDTLEDIIRAEKKLTNEVNLNRQLLDSLRLLQDKTKQCSKNDVNTER